MSRLQQETLKSGYIGQFAVTPDELHVAIPQREILAQMLVAGENSTLNSVCLAVAVVADALEAARQQTQCPAD
ncbi:MAG: hypothetical protein AAF529_06770 [Pseudomonadota bacterium]